MSGEFFRGILYSLLELRMGELHGHKILHHPFACSYFQGLWVGFRASIFWGLLWWVPQPKSLAIATGQYLIRLPSSMIMSLQINVQFISQQCVTWWSNFTSQCRKPYMAGHILWTLSSSSILSHSPFCCVPSMWFGKSMLSVFVEIYLGLNYILLLGV